MTKRRKLSGIIKELDEIAQALTGNNIPTLARQAWNDLRRPKTVEDSPETDIDDAYEVLGLDKDCTPSDIVARYRELAKKFHPDNWDTGDAEMFKKVTAAYEELCRQRGIR